MATYLRCELVDDLNQQLADAFEESHRFIEDFGVGAGVPTLVHCAQGRNRSAALVVNYMVQSGLFGSTTDAIATVRQRRPGGTLSNESFVQQLHERGP